MENSFHSIEMAHYITALNLHTINIIRRTFVRSSHRIQGDIDESQA
jgi:hypothetical protein